MVLLSLRNLAKAFGNARALRNVSLEIGSGEVHALVGENGAGKSTLMGILTGSLLPDAGSMEFQGIAYRPKSPQEAGNLGVSLVHQELALVPHLDIEANITLGREKSALGFLQGQSEGVKATLAELGYGHLDIRGRVGNLGVAERQIVEIARALFLDCRLILMDEPTSSLPSHDTEKLFEVIARLKAKGVSILYISHFLDEVSRIADRITVLRDGETVASGLPGATPTGEILQAMVGRPIIEIFPNSRRMHGPKVLKVMDWVTQAGAPPISLELYQGQILGIAGLVGSGRSSLLRTLYGRCQSVSGTMEMVDRGNMSRAGWCPQKAKDLGLGFLSEDRKEEGLALNLSIRSNATLADLKPFQGLGGLLHLGREAEVVKNLCNAWGVRFHFVDQPVGTLSGGNQQKVALSRLSLGETEVWLLDEPTRGVDVGAKAEIYKLISGWAERGKAVIWVSAYLPELFGVCDSLAVMHRHELSPVRPIKSWTEASVMAWATMGKPAGEGIKFEK
jgi:ribose transport system ATP-binding protein